LLNYIEIVPELGILNIDVHPYSLSRFVITLTVEEALCEQNKAIIYEAFKKVFGKRILIIEKVEQEEEERKVGFLANEAD
jgi:hypothetical protein